MATNVEKLLKLLQNQESSSFQDSNESFIDKDIYKTTMCKYRRNTDIYDFVRDFTDMVQNSKDETDAKATYAEMLLDRLHLPERQELATCHELDSMNVEEIKKALCETFGGKKAYRKYEKLFRKLTKESHVEMYKHFKQTLSNWKNYNYCREVNKKRRLDDEDFITNFVKSLSTAEKRFIKVEIKLKQITTIRELSDYLCKHGDEYDNSDSDSDSDASTSRREKEQENASKKKVITLEREIKEFKKKISEFEKSKHTLNTVQSQSEQINTQITEQLATEESKCLKDTRETNTKLTTFLSTMQEEMQKQSFNTQQMVNSLQEERRSIINTLQEQKSNEPYKPRYREQSPNRYENRSRSYSPGRQDRNYRPHNNSDRYRGNNSDRNNNNSYNSDKNNNNSYNNDRNSNNSYNNDRNNNNSYNNDNNNNNNYNNDRNNNSNYNNNRSRSRERNPRFSRGAASRSPSPTSNTCHSCKGEHWQIECPFYTREEKEVELLKMLEKHVQINGQDPKKEDELRERYKIPKGKLNQTLNHDMNKPVGGKGHFCKWCRTRGHNMMICTHYCPICEKLGHGWRECKSNPQLVEQRKQGLHNLITRLKFYSNQN